MLGRYERVPAAVSLAVFLYLGWPYLRGRQASPLAQEKSPAMARIEHLAARPAPTVRRDPFCPSDRNDKYAQRADAGPRALPAREAVPAAVPPPSAPAVQPAVAVPPALPASEPVPPGSPPPPAAGFQSAAEAPPGASAAAGAAGTGGKGGSPVLALQATLVSSRTACSVISGNLCRAGDVLPGPSPETGWQVHQIAVGKVVLRSGQTQLELAVRDPGPSLAQAARGP